MKFKSLVLILLAIPTTTWSQTTIEDKVTDVNNDEPIIFGTVTIYKDGLLLTGTETGFEGEYSLDGLKPGVYKLEASYVGYRPSKKTIEIIPTSDLFLIVNLKLQESDLLPRCSVQMWFDPPLINHFNTSSGRIINASEIKNFSNRN